MTLPVGGALSPINPADVGRAYEPIIRINSQSGKGGAAFVMEHNYGYCLPKAMHPDFGTVVQKETDRRGEELSAADIFELFEHEYIQFSYPYRLDHYHFEDEQDAGGHSHVTFSGTLYYMDTRYDVAGEGTARSTPSSRRSATSRSPTSTSSPTARTLSP
jgi:2-isopropylmalate synthase